MKHFICTNTITREELEQLFNLSDEIAKNPKKFSQKLNGKIIATLFYEPSTRTRLSFESAILRLGGGVISTENALVSASAAKGESLEDTIKIISGYADAIVIRHFDDNSAVRAAKVSTVPIINAGAGSAHHPTQSLLDAYTIKKLKGTLDNLSIAFIGDLKLGRTANSLIKLLALYKNIEVYGLSVKGMELCPEVVKFMQENRMTYKPCSGFDDLPYDIDVLYQTRVQRERIKDGSCPSALLINQQVINKFSPKTIVMHPLPRVDEISSDVDNDPRALYFQQAHNGVVTRQAIFLAILNEV